MKTISKQKCCCGSELYLETDDWENDGAYSLMYDNWMATHDRCDPRPMPPMILPQVRKG